MVLSDNRLLQGQVLLLYPQSGHGLRESELVWKNLSHGTAAGYPIRQCQEGSDPEESDRSFQSYIIPALRLRLGSAIERQSCSSSSIINMCIFVLLWGRCLWLF